MLGVMDVRANRVREVAEIVKARENKDMIVGNQ